MGNELVRKEQCPDCKKLGKDTSEDNLAVYSDGQTHCYGCGAHGYTTHTQKPIVIKEHNTAEWMHEYRGEFYSLPDRKLRAETLEKYKIKCEKGPKGNIIKHHYPYHNQKGEM